MRHVCREYLWGRHSFLSTISASRLGYVSIVTASRDAGVPKCVIMVVSDVILFIAVKVEFGIFEDAERKFLA